MNFSHETNKFREFSLWAGIILSIVISLLMIAAIFDILNMREKVKDIQVFLGGLSVLAASLYSFYASSAAAAETFRKNSQDDDSLRRNIRVNMILIAETLRQQSHARLMDLHNQTKKYELDKIHIQCYAGLSISVPEQSEEIWKNIGIVPQNIQLQYLNIINLSNMAEQDRTNGIALFKFLRDEHSSILEKTEKAAETMILDSNIIEELNKLGVECNKIDWNRIAGILANINNSAVDFLKKMEESRDWRPDRPPYPPNFEAHQHTKIGNTNQDKALRI